MANPESAAIDTVPCVEEEEIDQIRSSPSISLAEKVYEAVSSSLDDSE